MPLRQLDGVLKTVETMHVPLSKGQPDGAVETEDVDTDGALLARTPARVLARVLYCSAGSMHFHGSPSIGYSQFTASSVFVPPSLVLNQTQAARKAEALCRGRKPCD